MSTSSRPESCVLVVVAKIISAICGAGGSVGDPVSTAVGVEQPARISISAG